MAGIEPKARKTKQSGSRKSWETIHRGSPTRLGSPGLTSRASWRMKTSLISSTWRLKTRSTFVGSSMKSSVIEIKAPRLPSSPWRDLQRLCRKMIPHISLLKLWSSESYGTVGERLAWAKISGEMQTLGQEYLALMIKTRLVKILSSPTWPTNSLINRLRARTGTR